MIDSSIVDEQSALDLRLHPPRSVHATFQGVVMLARVADKASAAAFGHLGDYTFDCPLDKAVFAFLGIEGEDFLNAVRAGNLESFVDAYVARKTPAEISAWNEAFIGYVPAPDSDSWRRLVKMRDRYAPDRKDIVNWADVLDLDEGREVPLRSPRAEPK
jgi:hypothetical protein